jgi:hypothetical protein
MVSLVGCAGPRAALAVLLMHVLDMQRTPGCAPQ